MKKFEKVVIIGVGLIGGSIGLSLKANRLARKVIGVGHRKSSIKAALRLKTIDSGTLNPVLAVKGADLVILATPILLIEGMVRRIAPHLKKGCIVTDVGSTKTMITNKITRLMPRGVRFIGGHPMAGSEKRGVAYARRDLFKGSITILTRTGKTDSKALSMVKALWTALGARVIILTPKKHDKVVSQISHLPHMVVFSLLDSIDRSDIKFASSGLGDATRIALSDAKIWKDIAISNEKEILASISKFKKRLKDLEQALKNKDTKRLLQIFKSARAKRETLQR